MHERIELFAHGFRMLARSSAARLQSSVHDLDLGMFQSWDDYRLADVEDMLVDILTDLQRKRSVNLAEERREKLTGALFKVGLDLTWRYQRPLLRP